MNLIRNTLFTVLLLQLLGFLYFTYFINRVDTTKNKMLIKEKQLIQSTNTPISKNLNKIVQSSKPLPVSVQVIQKETIIAMKEVKTISKSLSTETKIETYAKKFLGNKYVWGATGPVNFDCSGFTQKVYLNCTGIHIPRVSRDQAKVGKYINYNELKQGDMVFFDTSKEHKGIVNHVGIYLKNGDFIHASSGGKRVMITNFNKKKFYKKRFLLGRRILQNPNTIATLVKDNKKEES